jgi:hypothetical protein
MTAHFALVFKQAGFGWRFVKFNNPATTLLAYSKRDIREYLEGN